MLHTVYKAYVYTEINNVFLKYDYLALCDYNFKYKTNYVFKEIKIQCFVIPSLLRFDYELKAIIFIYFYVNLKRFKTFLTEYEACTKIIPT